MSIRVTIVGNSGFARECYVVLRALQEHGQDIQCAGFLSFEGYPGDLQELSSLSLGIDDDYTFAQEEHAVIGIGAPYLRLRAYTKLKAKGVRFYNLIHPDVYVDKTVTLGEANIFTSGCYISCNCSIGNANVLNGVVHVGHDVRIGHSNFIAPGVQLGGHVHIGDQNSIGTLCAILPNCTIGNRNKIAPLSAVYKGCKDDICMMGNPAYKIGRTWEACNSSSPSEDSHDS